MDEDNLSGEDGLGVEEVTIFSGRFLGIFFYCQAFLLVVLSFWILSALGSGFFLASVNLLGEASVVLLGEAGASPLTFIEGVGLLVPFVLGPSGD